MERPDLQTDRAAASVNGRSILFLSHEFPPLGGGAGLNGLYLCEELHKRGWTVHVVTQRPPRDAVAQFPFPVAYIATFRTRLLQTKFSSMLLFIIGALLFMLKHRGIFDAVFSNMAIPAGIAGALIRATWKTPHIVWHHGGDVHGGRPQGAGHMQRLLLRLIWKSTVANCFVSEGLCALARSYGNLRNEAVIPVAPRLQPTEEAPAMRHFRYFLFLGRLEKVKNPLLLIAAMTELKKPGAAIPRLKIIGDGKLFNAVRREIRAQALENHITLEKNIPHDQVPRALQGAYALICPSLIEGFNMTILEAAHCGVPAIASDVPQINAIIEHRKNGLLFEGGSAVQLACCIKEVYENPSLRDILGKSAALSASAFSIGRSADMFENLYADRLVKTTRKRR